MFGRAKEHWSEAGLVVPGEYVEQLGDRGFVLLGEFAEAEVLAVGVLASIGGSDDEDTRTPLARLGEPEREREVAAAFDSLVQRGVVVGSRRRPAHVQGALGLLKRGFGAFRFLTKIWLDPATEDIAPRMVRQVNARTDSGRTLLLEQRLDPSTGRTQVLLVTPEATVDELIDAVFAEPDGPPPPDDSRVSVLRVLGLWGSDTGPQQVVVLVQRQEGFPEAEVVIAVKPHRTPPGRGDRATVHRAVTGLFTQGLAKPGGNLA